MFRLAFFLTVLWLSTAAAQLNKSDSVTNDVQAVADPIEETITSIGSEVCKPLQEIGSKYYEETGEEPDLSKLTLVYMTKTQNYTYNLTEAATVIPKEPWFDPSLPLVIYCHGFTDDPSGDSFQTIRSAYQERGDDNILALDASSQIGLFYIHSTIVVKYIGEALGELITALTKAGLMHFNVHIVGHSLGAHISGFAGKTVYNMTGSRVGRVTGLDPAGPCFAKFDSTTRLAKTDADFVDIIHTNRGVLGMDLQMGHVDYYPDGGSEQTNCLSPSCSHSRAWMYYAESVINTAAFIGVKCNSWEDFKKRRCAYNDTSLMGYPSTPVSIGKYYLKTSGTKPFGRGLDGLKY